MKYKGIICPMLTPFKADGNIDYEATEVLIEHLRKIGINGLFPLGSTGLFPFLRTEERKKFLEYVIEYSHGLPVLAGVGSSSTDQSVELALHAKQAGANALVIMPPYYITPGQPEIIKHFSSIIQKVHMSTFIYNIPQLAGARIELQTIETLKNNFPDIVGMKESSADMRYFSSIMRFSSNDFSIIQGQDDLLVPSLSIGADGGVCGLTNFSGDVVEAYKAFESGEYSKAKDIQINKIVPLLEKTNVSRFPSGYYKAFYEKFNLKGGYRSPMTEPKR
ncbi:MAG: dihydrodipicolinate synthase family protein [Thermoplasmatales archaeon]|nr:dihydrodipicolinate synthase family protein [Thermoplasmatales archaeon]MCW6170648.1 dihydrodipicolinate synthase family protein [Thermoplasmatales archaeon]